MKSIASKIDRLESEINRCLQEKRLCDDRLEELESQQHRLHKKEQVEELTLKAERVSGHVRADELEQMAVLNEEIRNTMAAMEENIQQLQQLIKELEGVERTTETAHESESTTAPEPSDDSGSTDGDALLGLVSELLSNPALMKMLPMLLKQLAK